MSEDRMTTEPEAGSASRADTAPREERPGDGAPRSGASDASGGRTRGLSTADVARAGSGDGHQELLFEPGRADQLRRRWTDVQAGFVDEPRESVQHADALVAEVMQTLAKTFADERAALEDQWSRDGDASTEDLRQALRRYRSFFDRLLAL